MTPAERKLVTELFDRLATLEDAPRDPDAERAIRDGLAQAPNAIYALVQTALVQDEALKSAHARIQELEGQLGSGNAQRQDSFLDSRRDSIWGRREEKGGSIWGREEPRGSVPNVRAGDAPMGAPPQFGGPGPQGGPQPGQYPGQQGGPYQGQPMGGPGYPPQGQMPPPEPGRGGGSFLGTAAAAAVGAIGGSLLMNSLRGMGGGGRSGQAMADTGHGGGGLPWNRSGGGDELSRSAGLDDIGRSSGSGPLGQSQGQGAFGSGGGKGGDTAAHDDTNVEDENYEENDDDNYDDDGGDFDTGGDE